MDRNDQIILERLGTNARISWADLTTFVVTGDDSYLLKVCTAGTKGLERIVLSTVKESLLPPMSLGNLP